VTTPTSLSNSLTAPGSLQKIGGFTGEGAEISAYDPTSRRLFVISGGTLLQVLDLSNPAQPQLVQTLDVAAYGGGANSVAIRDGRVAVAVQAETSTDPGQVVFFDIEGNFQKALPVGALPDMLTFSPDGQTVLVANEAEPSGYEPDSVDPVGSVSLIDLRQGLDQATVATTSFTSFNDRKAELQAQGIRIFGPNASVAQDLEPEYITVSADSKTAYVTLQENNALAVIDLASATVSALVPLGLKDFSPVGLDASDRDGPGGRGAINIQPRPVFGLYQPDAIASFALGDQTYLITANEGDARDYEGYAEEIRVGSSSYPLDSVRFPNAAELKQDALLGRLTVSRASGDLDGDGDYDQITSLGGRSFSIWDGSGKLVYDSGNQLEQVTAQTVPTLFNSNGDPASFDTRSDNKGPEPEGVVVGQVNSRFYAFLGLERTGGVLVYEVTNPAQPLLLDYLNPEGDISPEGLTWIPAANSPNGQPLLIATNEVSKTVGVLTFKPPTRISDVQGAGHVSPLVGQTVSLSGIVTAVTSNGFYLQDPNPDSSPATSEGIFVFRGSAGSKPAVGDAVQASGTVAEFRSSSRPNDLSVTQLTATSPDSGFTVRSSGNDLPKATVIGQGGRIPPNQVISQGAVNGTVEGSPFSPFQNGIDFYESLEGMRVQVNDAVAVGPTTSFGEIPVLADNGADASQRTARGGIVIRPDDFNPERIILDDVIVSREPEVNVGDRFGPITGVIDYSFSNFKLLNTTPLSVTSGNLPPETTELVGTANQLTLATFNVENLDPILEDINKVSQQSSSNVDDDLGDGKFAALASRIVNNLKSPDIISLEEIQDNTGAEIGDGVVDASLTYQILIAEILEAGGPRYEFRDIAPTEGADGGQPGGNIRVGFLFNPDRVSFVDRPGGSATTDTSIVNGTLSASPGRLDPTNSAFQASRKPLVGEFLFNGQTVYVIGNHFNSKGGDQPLFGRLQPPTLTTEPQRLQQAQVVRQFVDQLLGQNPDAYVAVVGDLNDFQFSPPLDILTQGGALSNLITTLPPDQQYTYNFEGNAQVLDHILVSFSLKSIAEVDIVHINSEFAQQVSDHDPIVSRFSFGAAPISAPALQ
jgi:uncharacterized protein